MIVVIKKMFKIENKVFKLRSLISFNCITFEKKN